MTKSSKKSNNNIDVYQLTLTLIKDVVYALNLPTFLINFVEPQVKSVPPDKLLRTLKLIYKELKQYDGVLNDG